MLFSQKPEILNPLSQYDPPHVLFVQYPRYHPIYGFVSLVLLSLGVFRKLTALRLKARALIKA